MKLTDYRLQIEALVSLRGGDAAAFRFVVFFEFENGKNFSTRGTAATHRECMDLAEAFLDEMTREVV